MKNEQARAIGVFFLLGLMEERVALSAAQRAIAQLKVEFPKLSRRGSEGDLVPITSVIRACRVSWKVYRKHIPRNQPTIAPELSWIIPPGLDLVVWSRYQKDAPDDDVMALLFSLVLEVPDEDLANGFQTSVGTIRYRLGKGIRQLGLVARSYKTGGPA